MKHYSCTKLNLRLLALFTIRYSTSFIRSAIKHSSLFSQTINSEEKKFNGIYNLVKHFFLFCWCSTVNKLECFCLKCLSSLVRYFWVSPEPTRVVPAKWQRKKVLEHRHQEEEEDDEKQDSSVNAPVSKMDLVRSSVPFLCLAQFMNVSWFCVF